MGPMGDVQKQLSSRLTDEELESLLLFVHLFQDTIC